MRCPDDGAKISTKDYDAEYEMYSCPRCGNMYTADEIEEAQNGTSPRKRAEAATRIAPLAKGKKRRTEILADAEELDKDTERIVAEVVKQDSKPRHRDEIPTTEVVNIWADEIQAVYEEMGGTLDEQNARDKALTLWREVQAQIGISVREQEVPYKLCKEHS